MEDVPGDAEREQVSGELYVLRNVRSVLGALQQRGQPAAGHAPLVSRQPPDLGDVAGDSVIVRPRDAVPGKHVEDRARRRVVKQVQRQIIDQAVGRARDQEPAVGERRAEARAEPAIGQRERAGQTVVERQVRLGPVTHSDRLVGSGLHLLRAGDESVHSSAIPLQMARVPALAGHAIGLLRGGRVVAADHLGVGIRVRRLRLAVASELEPVAPPGEHAQVAVVGMVLHHQDDNVLDLRQQVGAGRQRRDRALAWPECGHGATPALQLMPLKPLPHGAPPVVKRASLVAQPRRDETPATSPGQLATSRRLSGHTGLNNRETEQSRYI